MTAQVEPLPDVYALTRAAEALAEMTAQRDSARRWRVELEGQLAAAVRQLAESRVHGWQA